MTEQQSSNPYVGPRPFTAKEGNRFFGRDREARDLIPLVISERLVLFYAQSGAGKSSLIQARLIPGLRARNFSVLPVGRVSGEASGKAAVDNIYMHNLLVSLDPDREQAGAGLEKMTLPEFLANLEIDPPAQAGEGVGEGDAAYVDAPQIIEGVQPLALIIDQFEEIFTTHPEAWKQRAPFFEQLCQALEADPYLWIVLAIREDHVAALDPYAYLFPNKLRARFYMQRMGYNAALEAVIKPVEAPRPFEPGVAEELVNNLRRIPISEEKGDQVQTVESQYVEPVQLQVVCYQLWEQLKNQPGEHITADDLARLAHGGDLAQFVSRSLGEFYEQAIENVLKDPAVKVSERQLRDWFSTELITEAETRGSIFQGETKTGKLPNEVVRLLERQFIVRAETRASGIWYELSHDRFIGPILQANRAWSDRHPRPAQADAAAWDKAGRPPRRMLYEGRQLERALQMLASAPAGEWTDLEREFIQASQASAERQRSRRQGIGIALLALLVLVLTGLTVTSIRGQMRASANAALASTQGAIAVQQQRTAEQASIQEAYQARTAEAYSELADEQKQLAESRLLTSVAFSEQLAVEQKKAENARAIAETASALAAEERDKAEVARNEARAGQLASLSDFFRANNLQLSLLLSIEAVDLDNNWSTLSSLLTSIQHGIVNSLGRDGSTLSLGKKPYSAAYSPDGELFAVGLEDGSVNVVYTDGRARVEGIPASFKSEFTAYAVAFSSDSQILAQGNGDGSVIFWDRATNQVRRVYPLNPPYPFIFSLAFQPDGDLLAIATQRIPGTTRGAVVLYNYKQRKVERTWDCGLNDCIVVAWSPDGKKLAAGNKGGGFRIFDVKQNREVRAVDRAHSDQITGLAWYPDNQRLVTGGLDRRLVQWDTTTGTVLLESDRLETPVVISLALSPNGGRYLLVGAGGVKESIWASLWDAQTLTRLDFPMRQHSQGVPAVAFNPQGTRFATASFDSSVAIWKFEPVNPLSQFIASFPGGKLETIAQDGAGKLIVTQYSAGNQVNVLSPGVEGALKFNLLHSSAAAFTRDGKPMLALGGYEGQVTTYDLSTGKAVGKAMKLGAGSLRSLGVSADGSLIAAAVCKSTDDCSQVVLWDVASGEPVPLKGDLSTLNLGIVTAFAFSPDHQNLAIGNAKGLIYIYNIASGAVDQVVTEGLNLESVNLVVTSLAFGPENTDLLAAGFHDGRVALWQAAARRPIGQYDERLNGEVTALLLRMNEQGSLKLVTATGRGELREYDVDFKAWQQRACDLTNNHNFTPEERKKFLPESNPTALTCPR